ncbi:uncharacterized protein LOC133737941 [Rosa rugosa]|uniref:uncharacterized protein LOC133737941 n=1 Tax=Rosa rugosa TaxID=74645 RepID=UPI002B40AA77|nr:uncharacterized protein LOC133737941 [Rosa rugosa]
MVGMLTDEETEDQQPWTLFFDGSATSNGGGGGAGVVLTDPAGNTKALSFKLNFPCTNNTAEYEAFIIGMSTAVEMGVKNINIIGDSNLVINQMRGDFAVKEAALAPYRTIAEELMGTFDQATLKHIPGSTNRHGIPYKIITDNGTPFVNQEVSKMLKGYGIKHRKSSPYYPQGNGQAEATNKTLLRILSKMVFEYEQGWSTHLPDALWAYRTSPRTATGFSPYSLVYGSEAISPVELAVPTARVLTVNDTEWDAKSCSDWRLIDLEAADEQRQQAEEKMAAYHKRVTQAYNRTVKKRNFKEGDLVLRMVDWVRKQVSGPSKFAPQWEGPFIIKESHSSGYYVLASIIDGIPTSPINGKWLKLYCC